MVGLHGPALPLAQRVALAAPQSCRPVADRHPRWGSNSYWTWWPGQSS
jgi:hypothetical protein